MGKKKTKILALLVERHIENPSSESWGMEIANTTGVQPASAYPILRSLERSDWVLSRDEQPAASEDGTASPSRTFFRINPSHLVTIRQELAEKATDAKSAMKPYPAMIVPLT